jgi:hypothetical protein
MILHGLIVTTCFSQLCCTLVACFSYISTVRFFSHKAARLACIVLSSGEMESIFKL